MSTDQLLPLLRLFQLVSPSLPIGAYSFSQGLEWAVEQELVTDEATTQQWIGDILQYSLVNVDAPVLVRMCQAWNGKDLQKITYWNAFILASRETAELLSEDKHLGMALAKVIEDLDIDWQQHWGKAQTAFITPYSLIAVEWNIPIAMTVSGYLWGWLENQVLSAIKLVPLGQRAGQRILFELGKLIPGYIENIMQMEDSCIGGSLPMWAIASSRHETQYTRLFRS